MNLKCLPCVSKAKMAAQRANGSLYGDQPVINDALTLVPDWQEKTVGPGQVVMACVAVPVCEDCLQVEQKSALDLASGVILQPPK